MNNEQRSRLRGLATVMHQMANGVKTVQELSRDAVFQSITFFAECLEKFVEDSTPRPKRMKPKKAYRKEKKLATPAPVKKSGSVVKAVEKLLRQRVWTVAELVKETGVKHPATVFKAVRRLRAREVTGGGRRARWKRYTLQPEVTYLPPKGPPKERPNPTIPATVKAVLPKPPIIRRRSDPTQPTPKEVQ